MINNIIFPKKKSKPFEIKENNTQEGIRQEIEQKVISGLFDLYWDVVSLNLIHNDPLRGDNRTKDNLKLEKYLEKHIEKLRKKGLLTDAQ